MKLVGRVPVFLAGSTILLGVLRVHVLPIVFILLLCCQAEADETDVFMKVDCHPETTSAHLHVFGDSKESGEARLERHERDLYELGYMTGKPPIICDLKGGQGVSVSPHFSPNSNSNNVDIGSPEGGATYWTDAGDDWDFFLDATDDGKFKSRYCATNDRNFSKKERQRFANEFAQHKNVCRIREMGHSTYSVDAVPVAENEPD